MDIFYNIPPKKIKHAILFKGKNRYPSRCCDYNHQVLTVSLLKAYLSVQLRILQKMNSQCVLCKASPYVKCSHILTISWIIFISLLRMLQDQAFTITKSLVNSPKCQGYSQSQYIFNPGKQCQKGRQMTPVCLTIAT